MRSFPVHSVKVITFFIVTLLLSPAWANKEAGKVQNVKHIYTVIEFESTFMNRKREKVLKTLGEPDVKWEHRDKEIWTYNNIITEQDEIWHQNIMFDFGRVNRMWGDLSFEEKK
jgi:hypothetical protein